MDSSMEIDKDLIAKDVYNNSSDVFAVPQRSIKGMHRRSHSTGNLNNVTSDKYGNNSDESSSGEIDRITKINLGLKSNIDLGGHSDSDDNISFTCPSSNASQKKTQINPFRLTTFSNDDNLNHRNSRYKYNGGNKFSICCGPESDSYNENFPSTTRPSIRRKRKLKRICVDPTITHHHTTLLAGKRKRASTFSTPAMQQATSSGSKTAIKGNITKPIIQTVIDKFQKLDTNNSSSASNSYSTSPMESFMSVDVNCDSESESSINLSGSEGHDGDDELTDWAPETTSNSSLHSSEFFLSNIGHNNNLKLDLFSDSSREIRSGYRRVLDPARSNVSFQTQNSSVSSFIRDSQMTEMQFECQDKEAVSHLAALYSLEVIQTDSQDVVVLKKTSKTPGIYRHHLGLFNGHKRVKTQNK